MPATPEGTALAFDLGTRRIGVAVGNRISHSARALATIEADDWTRLDAIVAEWDPAALVVGLPLTLEGTEQTMSTRARAFARRIGERYARPVELVDERHSSGEAARRFADRRAQGLARRKHAGAIDSLAAQVILEHWLAHAPRTPDPTTGSTGDD